MADAVTPLSESATPLSPPEPRRKRRSAGASRRRTVAYAVVRGDAVRVSRDSGRGVEWVGLLPKSQYLIRVISVPPAPLDELQEMVRLKTEATLPADYGPIETGFRRLGMSELGMEQLEVYAAKCEHIDACVARLSDLGGRVVAVLPSASVWVDVLTGDGASSRDLVVAPPGADAAGEAAFFNPDGSVSVRHLGGSDTAAWRRGVEESVRAANSVRPSGVDALTAGWIGSSSEPRPASSQGLEWRDDGGVLAGGVDEAVLDDWLLRLAGGREISWPVEANLLPRSLRLARGRRQITTRLLVGMVAGLASLGLVVVALKVHTARHAEATRVLEAEITRIGAAGEAVGWKLDQLEALEAARSTRNDFAEVLVALHEACPPSGLSFSQLELGPEGTIQMRGQAESLAMPFELPQQLEGRDTFTDVLLQDAGQTRKAGGSVTEFRLEARHQRGAHP